MKAKITKKDGQIIEMEGSVEEIARIVDPPVPQIPLQQQGPYDPSFGKTLDDPLRRPRDQGFGQWQQIVYNDMCPMGGPHEYPQVWMSISPLACSKCGKAPGPPLDTTIVSTQTISGALVENGTQHALPSTLPAVPFISAFTIVSAESQS